MRPRSSRARARDRIGAAFSASALSAALLAACSGNSGAGAASQAPCGAPPGDWQYVLSCDTEFAGLVRQCVDYYATAAAASAVQVSFQAVCQASSGTVLGGPCSAEHSAGSCVVTASSGPIGSSPQAALSRIYMYDDSSSAASFKASCERQHGVYVAPDGSSAVPSSAPAASCGSTASNPGTGRVAFSMQTLLNGEIIECTNYTGSVTTAQLESVLALGALTTPCPTANAVCSCEQNPGSGPFGTDATLYYYQTSFDASSNVCPSSGANCRSLAP